ncbi:MAG: M36 family metallopeptidase [Verrucomicrobia bacterium]|nr:M36 family metallopeptidase [Verrucomicrobiota bacterium]
MSAERGKALAALRLEVPGVQVDFDPLTGAPSHIMAAGRFLAQATPGVQDAYAPVHDFVTRHATLFGHGVAAMQPGQARVTREDVTAHNGMRTVVWQQEVAGVPVFQTILKANLTKNGDLLTLGSHFMSDPAKAAGKQVKQVPQPPLDAADAMTRVATNLGGELQRDAVTPKPATQSAEKTQKLTVPGYSDTTAHLSWVPMDEDTLRLAWEIETFSLQQNEMFRLLIDAEDGKILVRQSLTADISNASYRVFTGDSPTPMTPGHNTPLSTQPAEVARSLVMTQALNTTASPEGWIPDGQNETVGNNVDAHLDLNADNIADTPRPQGSPSRVLDFPFNSASEPTTYRNASVTQLFYYNNWIHDRMYELGFTESAGNFQTNNFGRGGNGNDAVQADAQDGSGTNNANFSTPSDGSPGRMQMFIWPGAVPDRDSSFDGDIVVHEYGHGISNRLVGGGVGISAWQSRGMGEGWSDFYAMSLLSEAADNVNGVYAMGGYSTYLLSGMSTNYYFGIRRYPYCTDMMKAPLTYKDIDPTQALPHTGIPLSPRYGSSNGDPSQYHAQGEVWCNMLLECRANIITARGWAVGNMLMLRIVTDGLKLTPANPTFIQARDAIIQADLVNNAGANANYLWAGFAKRGMGASASGPANSTTTGVVEAYDIPDDLQVSPATPFAATGVLGGPFAPASRTITLNNIGSASLNWTANASQPWLLLSRTAGSLAGGANDSITASFSAAANNLAPGSYNAMIDFTNSTSGAVIQRQVSLTVDPLRITILAEPFDAPTLSGAWTVTGTGPFRTQVTAANAPRASNHLTMDSSIDATYARNEATLTVNLADQNDVELSFWAKGFGEDSHGPPTSPFINGADFDGVAISADGGTTWYEVQGLRSLSNSWTKYTVDLDAAIAARGLNYTSSFKIRFNQYDNYGISTDGIAIDDILIAQSISSNLTLSLPVQAVTEGASDVIATLNVTPVQTSALTVTLSANTADVLLPATVTVPANTNQITIPVTIVDDVLLDGSQTVVLTVNAATFPTGTTALTVHDNETAVLTVDAPLNGIEGSSSLTGTVSVPVAVDAAVTITLESSNPGAAVPASVIIPAGQTSAQFFITLANDGFINGSRSAVFTASVTGWTTGADTLNILDDENANLVLAQTVPSINEGDGLRAAAGRISINGLTQSDVVISLSSSDTGELTVPTNIMLPAGATQTSFAMTAVNDSDLDGPQNVTITATAPGFIDGMLVVVVQDEESAAVAWNPRPAHLSTNNPVASDLAWSVSEGNLITNGDFEAGLSDWSFNVPGGPMFRLQTGTLDPTGADTPTPAYSGAASMIFASNSTSGLWVMFQDVAVPPDGPAPVLQWMQRIRNTGTSYTATQQYRLEIRDPATDAVLATPFVTAPGSPLLVDWSAQSANLSAWRGRSIRVAFVVQPGSAILNVLLDDIRIQQRPAGSSYEVYFGTNPTPGASELLGTTTAPAWSLPDLTLGTTYFWKVITQKGAESIEGPVWRFSVPAAGSVASFAWSSISSPQSSGTDIPVTVTALDALGNVATGFTGTANVSAVLPAVTQRSILITEHSTWTTDEFEFTNTTNAPVDVSGWKIQMTQFNSFPAPYLTFVIPNATTVAAGGIFRLMESGTSPGTYPLFRTGLSLNHSTTTNSYVVLRNANDEVVDFVISGGDPRLLTPTLPTEVWSGSAVPAIGSTVAGQTLQRIGNRDNNSASDWQVAVATPAALNVGLTLPFQAAPVAARVSPTTTAAFTAGVWSGNVDVLSAGTNLRLRASESGGKFGESNAFTVTTPNGMLAISGTATVNEGAGTVSAFGTVTLPAAAVSPVTVSFLVNTASQASVADVTITAGMTSASFDLAMVDDSLVEGAHSITITPVAAGYASSIPLSVGITDNEGVILTLTAPASATEGQGTLANALTITAGAAPVNAVTISLSSNDTTEATVPASVVLPAGQTSVTANLTSVNDALLDLAQNVTLTASAGGFTSGTAAMTVNDNEPATITLAAPAVMAENAGTVTAAGTVTLGGQAPANMSLALSSSSTASLTVPATVTVLAGQSSATFAITVVDDSTPEANAAVTLNASFAGLTEGTANVSVRDDEAVSFALAAISAQKAATPFPVTISARNTSGDAVTGFTGPAALNAPGNTISPLNTTNFTAGSWTGNVTLGSVAASQTLTATAGAVSGTSAAFAVNAGDLASFALSAVSSPQVANVPFSLTATAKDALGQDLTGYAGPARLVQLGAAQMQPVGAFPGTTTTSLPLQTSGFNRQRSVLLVRAAELGTARQLTSMGVHFLAVPPTLGRLVVRMKNTPATAVASADAWDNTGWRVVYDAPWNVTQAGWADLAFSSPFTTDGVSSLLMEIIHTSPANGLWNGSMSAVSAGYTALAQAAVASSSTVNADPMLWTATSPTKSSSSTRPLLRFNARVVRDASPTLLAAFTNGAFSGDVAAPYGGTGQNLGVWDVAAGVLSETNAFAVTSAGTLAVSFSGNATEGGADITGTITASAAPTSDLTVTLTPSNAADVALPASVTILAGQTTAIFAASAVDDMLIESVETISVTASAEGYDFGSGSFTITDNDGAVLSVVLPASVTEGATASTGTVSASAAAPVNVTIALAAAPAGLVTVPTSVTLPAGQTSVTFSISAVNNTAIDGTRSATVTASTAGWTSGNATLDVLDNEALTLTVNLASTTPREGNLPVSGMVALSGTTATAMTVALSSDDTSEATVPASVTIAAGTSSAAFSLTVLDDAVTDGTQPVLITASAAGFTDGTRSLQVLDNDLAGFAFATVPNPQVRNTPFAVTITSVDVNGALIPTFTDTVNLSAAGAGGAVMVAPAMSGAFVNGTWTGNVTATQAETGVTITAAGTGGLTGTSNTFDVLTAGALSQFAISGIGATQVSGTATPVTVTAQDAAGNPVTSYNGNASFSLSAGPSAAEVVTGTGTITSFLPLWTTNQDMRMQTIYLPSEVGSARTLRSMAFEVVAPPGMDMRNFTIRLKHTSRVDYATAANVVFETTGWTTVYQRDIGIPTVGWNTLVFQTPFIYDGMQNLLVDISYNNSSVSAAAGTVRHTSTSPVRSVYATSSSTDGDPLTWNGSVGPSAFSLSTRINLRFSGFLPVTVSPAASGTFAGGVWSGDLTFASSGPGVVLRALNGAGISGQTAPFTLNGAVMDHFDFAAISSPQTTGTNVPVTVTAKDANNMPVPGFTSTAALSAAEQAMKAQTGSGTSITSVPLGSQSRTQRMQVIYLASELGGTARRLTGLDLNPSTAPGSSLNNFTIRAKHTSKADFVAAGTAVWESTGWTTVFQGNVTIAEAGWVSFPFTTSFEYDGTRNLMVDYSYNNTSTGAVQGFVRHTTASANRTVSRQTDLNEGDPLAWNEWSSPMPTASTGVPNARFSSSAALPLTPVVTGSFTNGVWSGNLAINQPASRVELTAASGGSTGTSGLFHVNGIGTLSLTLPPSAAEGASPLSATLTRTGSTVDALTVNLVSSDTTEATVAEASVTIPAGSASTTFNVNVEDDELADGPQSLVISAAAVNHLSAEAALTVTDNEALTLLVSTPPGIVENVPTAGSGYVRVNQATATALTVNLTSSDTTELTVPASVTIAAGSLSATFAITAVDDTLMDGPQTVNVTASAAGHANGVASTVVQDNESFLLSLSTTSVVENAAPLSSTISLSGAAAADVTVSLSVNDDSELLLAPNTTTAGSTSLNVTIPAGSSSIIIALVPVDDAVKDGNQSVTVTLSAPGFTTTPRFVNVIDDELERYVLSPVASPQTVGATFSVTATAQNISGSTITNRSGTLNLAASNAVGVLAMTPGTVTLTGGTGTFNASLAAPASGVSITATDAQNVSAQSSVFDVIVAGALNRLAWNSLTTPQLIESPISATVTARDAANNVVTGYTGPADLKLFSTTADTTIGTGTTSWTTPLGSFPHARTQGIYLASELGAAKRLTGLALNVLTSSTTLLNNFTIRLKHTSSTSFSSAAWESGWTTVFSGTRTYNAIGWQNTVFTRPFDYDGVSNVMVDISFGNVTTGTAVALQASTTASTRSVTLNTSITFNGLPVTWTGTTNTPSTSTNLLNVRFTNATPLTVAVSGPMQNTSGTGTNEWSIPLGSQSRTQRMQVIYLPTEVGSARRLDNLALNPSTAPGSMLTNFTIRLKHTPLTSYSSFSWDSTGWTTVYQANTTISAAGWRQFDFTTPFDYNGTSSLMVDFSYYNTAAGTTQGYTLFTTASSTRTVLLQTDTDFGSPLLWAGTANPTPVSNTVVPNARFGSNGVSLSVTPPSTSGFTNGSWSGTISSRLGGASVFFAADDPATGISGYSNAIAINTSGTLALTFLGTLAEGNGTVANGGTLTLSAAPASALTVALTSANPAQMTVPATVTVPAGQTSVSIPVTLINDSIIEGPQSIAVTAIAPGYTRVTANAAIADNDGGTFTLTTPASVAEGSSSFNATLNASVTSSVAVTVSLSSSDTTELTVPATVTLPANASSVNFTVTVVDDVIQDGPQNAVITASATNWTSGTATVSVTDNDPLPALSIYTYNLTEGGTSSSNYVYISPAPASAVTVSLSSDSGAVTVPATVTVAAGFNYGYFTTTAPEDSLSTGTRYATISASATGYRSAGMVSAVTDNDVSAYRIANITGTPVAGAPVSVTVTAISADGSTVTAYTGTVNLSATGSNGTIPITPIVSGSFSSGVWTGNVAFNQVTTGIVLSATDAQSRTGSSNAFNTTFSTLDHFTWATVPSPQAASTPFNATVMAKDVYENTVASFTGPAKLSALKPGTETTSGTGVVSNTTLLTGTYDDSRTQSIYLPVEVGGAQTIGAVSFNVTTASAIPFANFTVRMKHATRTDFATSPTWDSTGWTTVYRGAPAFSVTGWNQLLLTTPFTYNGTDNLMVDVVWDKTTPGNGVTVQSTTISPVRSMYYGVFTSWGYGSPLTWSGTYPSYITTTSLPNMRFQSASTVVVLPQSTGAFAAGAWTAPLTVTQSGTGLRLQASGSGVQSLSNAFNVTSGGTLSLNLAASAIEGAAPLTATLDIAAAPVSDLMVTLASTNTAAATVPATITIPSGQTSVTFPVTVIDDALLDGTQSAVITALVTGYDAGVSTLNVLDNETTTITLTLPATLAENAAATTGTITLSNAAGSDVTLPLTSSDTTELSAPASVTIPAGSTSATFAITPVDDAVIDFTQNVTVSTGMAGWTGASGIVSITDNETAVLSLSFTSSVGESGGTLTATLTSSNPVQNATTVTLTSADTTEATVPATATIATGASSTSFAITIINDTDKDGSQTFAITAAASGFTTGTRNLTVTDNDVHNFLVSAISGPQVRNAHFSVTFTARDVNNATITTYPGTPTLTAMDGAMALGITPSSLSGFSSGVKTQSINIGSFATNAVITVTDTAAGATGSSNAFGVTYGAHTKFAWDTITSPQAPTIPFATTITAQDAQGNTVSSFTSTASLTTRTEASVGTASTTADVPFSTYFNSDARTQMIFTAAEAGAARSINSLAFNATAFSGVSMTNFTIRMRHTTKADYTGTGNATWESTGWTTCYQGTYLPASTGWNTIFLTTPFAYDGSQNLMIDVSFNDVSSAFTGSTTVSASTTAATRVLYYGTLASSTDPLTWSSTSPAGSASSTRPDIRLGAAVAATPSPSTTGAFTAGVWTGNVALSSAVSNVQLQAASGSLLGFSNSFSATNPVTLSVTMPASSVESAGTVSGTVSIGAAQGSALVVTLASNDTTEAQPATSTVTIPAGSTSVGFTLNIINDTLKDGAQSAVITASAASAAGGTATISVVDDDPNSFAWAAISSPKTSGVNFSVTINARTIDDQPATAFNGSTASLSALVSGSAASVTPTTGAFTSASWTGNVTILSSAAGPATITATGGGGSGTSAAFSFILPTLGVTLPTSASESAGTVSGTISMSTAQTVTTTVNLTSNDTTEAQPATASVTIPAGSTTVGFTLNIINDSLTDGAQTAAITASATGANSGTRSISITDDDVHNFLISAVGGTQVRNAPFSVTFTARDLNNVTITGYNGSPVLTASDGGTSLAASPGTISGFSSGVKSQSVTVGSFATSAVLTLTDPVTGGSGSSNAFVVTVGPMSKFAWDTISPPKVANVAFPVTITAQDAAGNNVTSYSGSAVLSALASSTTLNIGTGSVTNYAIPFNTIFTKCRSQQVHLANEVGALGLITSLAVNVTSVPVAETLTDFTIRLKHTARTGYSVSPSDQIWETDGFTTVYQGSPTISTTGYVTFTFSTPFAYDGVSGLMVDYSYRVASNTSNRPTVTGTTRGNFRTISFYTSTTTYGEPLTWAGTSPAAFPDSRITDIRLNVASYYPLSPTVSTAFTNGVWTGTLGIGSTASSVSVIAADASLTGTSNNFEVIATALTLSPEPVFTGGLTNILSWNQPAADLEYELERSSTPSFAAPVSSGYLTSSTTTLAGLADGQTYHYRARMRRQGALSWTSDWSPAVFSTQDATPPALNIPDLTTANASATLTGTAIDATSGVSTVTVAGNAASTSNAFANWTRDVTGLADGSNSITVTASDNAVPPNTTNVTAIVYRITTPTGDPNNNGINSLVEHALGIPAGAANAHSMLPAATIQTESGTGAKYLSMQFRRRIQRAGLAYTVETSTNLSHWDATGASVQEMSATPTGDGVTEAVTVRVTPAMSPSNTRGYVRLSITTN